MEKKQTWSEMLTVVLGWGRQYLNLYEKKNQTKENFNFVVLV